MTQEARNVHQRKLGVMKRCAAITPDSKYNGQTKDGRPIRFEYLSVQAISNHVRSFCVEEGLDIVPSISSDNLVVLELVNADDPEDKIVATWPLVPNDKAWAYSVKYALIRTFLIGDGEEGDEAEMADRSAQPVARNGQATPTPKPSPSVQPTAEEMEQLYALTDQLGQTRESVAKVVEIRSYGTVFARAQQALEKREVEAREAEAGTLPLGSEAG